MCAKSVTREALSSSSVFLYISLVSCPCLQAEEKKRRGENDVHAQRQNRRLCQVFLSPFPPSKERGREGKRKDSCLFLLSRLDFLGVTCAGPPPT